MVGAIVRWIKDRLGIAALERENAQLAKAVLALGQRLDEEITNRKMHGGDLEARIAFLENSLTAKQTAAKIVPKAHKATTRQFLEAASKATEQDQGEA